MHWETVVRTNIQLVYSAATLPCKMKTSPATATMPERTVVYARIGLQIREHGAWNRPPTELKLLRSTDLFRRVWNIFCFILSTGTNIRIDPVMRPRSSSRGRNTSASVTVTNSELLFMSTSH